MQKLHKTEGVSYIKLLLICFSASGLKTHWKTANCISPESVVEFSHVFETASHEGNFHETEEFKMDTGSEYDMPLRCYSQNGSTSSRDVTFCQDNRDDVLSQENGRVEAIMSESMCHSMNSDDITSISSNHNQEVS